MKKRLLTAALTGIMALSMPITAAAAETTTHTEDGYAAIDVTATVSSGYTVKLPAALVLSEDGQGGFKAEGIVGVKGNIASNKSVVVVPVSGDKENGVITEETENVATMFVENIAADNFDGMSFNPDLFEGEIYFKNKNDSSKGVYGNIQQNYVRFISSHADRALDKGDIKLNQDHETYVESDVKLKVNPDEPAVYEGTVLYTFRLCDLRN